MEGRKKGRPPLYVRCHKNRRCDHIRWGHGMRRHSYFCIHTGSLLALAMLALAGVARGQIAIATVDNEEQPQQKFDGFSVRKEAGKFNDALEDFARYRDK